MVLRLPATRRLAHRVLAVWLGLVLIASTGSYLPLRAVPSGTAYASTGPPEVLDVLPAEGETVRGTVALTVYARCEEGAVFSVEYRSEMTGWEWLPLGEAVETARAEGVSRAVYEWDTGGLPDGVYNVRAVVTDAGGTTVGPVQGEGQDWRLLFVLGAPPEQPPEQEPEEPELPEPPDPQRCNLSFEDDLSGWLKDVRTDTVEQTHNLYSCDIVTDRCSHGSKAVFGRAEIDRWQSPSGTGCTQLILWSDFMDLTKLESISLDMTDIASFRRHAGGGDIYSGWANEVQVLISDANWNTAGCIIYDDDEASVKMYGAPQNRYQHSFNIGGNTWYRYTVTKDDFTGEQRAKYSESIVTGDVSAVDLSRARIGVQWFTLFWNNSAEGDISSVVDNLVIHMDESGPAVIATDPPAGADDVYRDAIISITYDEEVLPGPGFEEITLARDGGGTVDIRLTLDGSTLFAEPMTNLEHGVAYVLTVPAGALLDEAGNPTESDYLLRFTVAPLDTQPPSPPGGVNAVCHGARWVSLSWEPATDDRGVAGYVVLRGDSPEGPFEELAWVEPEVCSWQDTGIAAGATYYYQILAEDAEGNLSAPSSAVGVTTGADNPLIRVSVASDGTEGDFDSWYPSISGDGRYVVFASYASNLAGPDENWEYDVFLHDCETGVTERITNAYGGGEANDWSGEARISGNGRYVVFTSDADNLVPGDTNGRSDIFLYDRETGTTACLSRAPDGTPANNDSGGPRISADGSRVLFYSYATNLTPEGKTGVFLYDAGSGLITRLADYTSDFAISGDGRYAACQGREDIRWGTLIFDLGAPGASVKVEFVPDAKESVLSYDGRYLAYRVGNDRLFVRDLQTGATELASVASDGAQGNGNSYGPPSLSADGRYVAFCSSASNLVPGDTNGRTDIFVRDRLTSQTVMVSVAAGSNAPGNASSESPALSADGKYVAFQSWADDLVPDDTNYTLDVFRYSLSGIWGEGGALAVRGTDPVNGAAGVLVSKTIRITFNRPVRPGPDWEQIALKDEDGSEVPAARSIEGAELILDPEGLLAPGARYTVRLPARGVTDAEGNALAGDCVFVFDTGADAEPPGVPPGFRAAAEGAHSVRLTWAPATDDVGVVSYEIARSRNPGGPFEVIYQAGATDTGYLDGGLEVNATYYYRIVALDAAGNRSDPAEARATTLDVTPPAAPAGLAALGLDLHSVSLSWQAAADDVGVTSYAIYRAESPSGPFELIAEVGGGVLTLQDTGLKAGTSYFYCVKARDAAGNESAFSAVAEVRTAANQPPEITPDRSVWEIAGRKATLTGGVADPQGVAAVWAVGGGREWPVQLIGGRWSVQVEIAGYEGVFTIKARDVEGAEGFAEVTVRDCSVYLSGFGFTDPIAYGSGSACTPLSRLWYQYTDCSGTGVEVRELAVLDRTGWGQAVTFEVSVERGGSPGGPPGGKIEFVPQTPMPPGFYTLKARVVNRAGMAAELEQDFTVYAHPPTVEIYQPAAGAEVAFGTYFEGRVLDNTCQGLKSWQAALNGVPLEGLVLDEEGKFKTALELAPGEYVLSLTAADHYGWMREGNRDTSTVQVRFKVSGRVTAVKSYCQGWNAGSWKWWFKVGEFDRAFLQSRGEGIPLVVNPLVTNKVNGGRGFSATAGLTVKNPKTGEVYEKDIFLKNFAHQEDPAFSWGADYPTHSLTVVPASFLTDAGEMEVTLRQYPGRDVEAAKEHVFIGYPAPYIHAGRDNWSHRPAYLKPYYGETVEDSPVVILAYVTDDTGTGISGLTLEVDGREVPFSPSEKAGDVEVTCALDLSQGQHTAKLTAVNGMGLSTTAVTVFTVGSGSAVPWMEVRRGNDTYQVYLSFSRELSESEKAAIKGRYISPSSISSEIQGAALKQVSVRRIAGGQTELVTDPALAREILLAAMRGAYYGEHPQGASLVDSDLVEWINEWKDNWGYGVLRTLCPNPPPKPSRENVQKALVVSALAGGDTPSLLSGEMSSALSTFSTAVGAVSKVKDVEKVQDAMEAFSPRGAKVAGLVVDALSLVDEGAQLSKDMAEAVFRAYWQAAALADYRESLNRIALLIEDGGLRSTVNSLANFSFEEACEVIKRQAAETIRKKTVEKMREAFEDAVKESFKATNPVVAAVLTGLDVGFFLASYTGWEQAYTANFQGSYEAAAEEGFNEPAAILGQGCLLMGRGKTDFYQATDTALATKLQTFAASRFYGTVAGMMSIFKNYPGLTDRAQYEAAYRQRSSQLLNQAKAAVPGLASSSRDYFDLVAKLAKLNLATGSLVVNAYSPVTIVLADPLGRQVGCGRDGRLFFEIPGATYNGPEAEPQTITVVNPLPGDYRVSVYSTVSEAETEPQPYTVTIESQMVDGSVISRVERSGTVAARTPGTEEPDALIKLAANPYGQMVEGDTPFILTGVTCRPDTVTAAGTSGSTAAVQIGAGISKDALVTVLIRDAAGNPVVELLHEQPLGAGQFKVLWDGRDAGGQLVANGTYQYVVRAEDGEGNSLAEEGQVRVDVRLVAPPASPPAFGGGDADRFRQQEAEACTLEVAALPEATPAAAITLSGRTAPGQKLQVTLNHVTWTVTADQKGTFSLELTLQPGANTIEIFAPDAAGGRAAAWKATVVRISPDLRDLAGHWAENDILALVARGIVGGYPDRSFRPNQPVTRAEFTALLVRALGLRERPDGTFVDCVGRWYAGAVEAAHRAGLVVGTRESRFEPEREITRQEMAVIMARALEKRGVQTAPGNLQVFSDAALISPWAQKQAAQAVGAGIVRGADGRFLPLRSATRAEAVVMLKRLLDKIAEGADAAGDVCGMSTGAER
ncbi:MAG: Ig-like domain-containing protein [Moorellales bacterium]